MLRPMARRAVAATVVALAVALLVPAAGSAGTYSVWSCTGPDGSGSPTDVWRAEVMNARFSNPVDNCASGGGLFAHLNGDFDHPANTAYVRWHFVAPENTSIAGYRMWRSARVSPTSYNATPVFWIAWPVDAFDGANVKEPHCAGHECSGLGDPAKPFDAGNLVTATNMSGVTNLYVVASCGGTTGFICAAADSPPGQDAVNFRIHGTDITMRDDLDPRLSGPSGTLIEPRRTLTGVHGVSVAAEDEGSGLYDILLEVDGQVVSAAPVSTNSGQCVKPFRVVVPCKLAATASASLDTATLADGAHSLRVIVRDATESNQAV